MDVSGWPAGSSTLPGHARHWVVVLGGRSGWSFWVVVLGGRCGWSFWVVAVGGRSWHPVDTLAMLGLHSQYQS